MDSIYLWTGLLRGLCGAISTNLAMTVGCAVAMPFLAHADSDKVKVFAAYTSYEGDGEHESGLTIELWKYKGKPLGFINYHVGLVGDSPIGRLEGVKYDEKTGQFAFVARLTLGAHHCKTHSGVPSRNWVEFAGRLTKQEILGTLKMFDRLHKDASPREEQIELQRTPWPTYRQVEKNLSDWQAFWGKVLKFRGPKWGKE